MGIRRSSTEVNGTYTKVRCSKYQEVIKDLAEKWSVREQEVIQLLVSAYTLEDVSILINLLGERRNAGFSSQDINTLILLRSLLDTYIIEANDVQVKQTQLKRSSLLDLEGN